MAHGDSQPSYNAVYILYSSKHFTLASILRLWLGNRQKERLFAIDVYSMVLALLIKDW